MDHGRGSFTQRDTLDTLDALIAGELGNRSLKKSGLFIEHETLEIRGSRFRVQNITRHTLVLRLLPRAEVVNDE